MMKIGEKIRELRTARGVSQETLAEHLGVSFQAVSKWERGESMPDVTLIPAAASYFGVSTDELFGFNLYEVERNVRAICDEAYRYRGTDDAKAEAILREGLLKYPGNDVLLNNLLYTLDPEERSAEVIGICKRLIAATKDDEVRLDAIRILGETYFRVGENTLGKETVEQIPEIYFTKPALKARLFDDDERFPEAWKEQFICLERLAEMTGILGELYENRGDRASAAAEYGFAAAVLRAAGEIAAPPWYRAGWRQETLEAFLRKRGVTDA